MGRKVHPIGYRLKINKDWEARWFAEGRLALENNRVKADIAQASARALRSPWPA